MSVKRDGFALPELTEENEDEEKTAALQESGQDNIHFKVTRLRLCTSVLPHKLFFKNIKQDKFSYYKCKLIFDDSQQ
jgi:hypothetical protein